MSTPTLVYRPADTIDFPDLRILGRAVSPYVLDAENSDYVDLAVEYTIDADEAVLALYLFLRDAMPAELENAMAAPGDTALPAHIAALGLTAQYDHGRVADQHEINLTLHSADLVLGIFATSLTQEVTEAALSFALSQLVPHFLQVE